MTVMGERGATIARRPIERTPRAAIARRRRAATAYSKGVIVTLIPGDGIGPEVTNAVVRILDEAGPRIEWERHDAGLTTVERGGTPLPNDLIDSITRNRVALKGPVTTPIGGGFTS